MVAANYSTVRSNLKEYCDRATDENEIVLVTRKSDKNVIIMSLEQYNLIEKELRNAAYLAKIDRAIAQKNAGTMQEHDIIDV